MLNSGKIPWYFHPAVTYFDKQQEQLQHEYWNWYLTHLIYFEIPQSEIFHNVDSLFRPAFAKVGEEVKTWVRIKANFYPFTDQVKEHQPHIDMTYSHKAALFSLNTCDGFTKMADGKEVQSIANRVVIFDGSHTHSSSTTSNDRARVNLNFNFF